MTKVIQTRRSRQTGTVVDVVDRAEDDRGWDGHRWETICVDHGHVCSHETRVLAMRFAPVPLEWCEACMDAAGMRDHENVPPERNLDGDLADRPVEHVDLPAGSGVTCACSECEPHPADSGYTHRFD